MFKIVFRGNSLYPKQLPLCCLLRLINASTDHNGYITNFCGMVKLLHKLEKGGCLHRSIREFGNVSAGKKEN